MRRIAYADGNRVPTAIIEGEQLWDETLKVEFDGSSSSDPDGDTPLTYLWDFGDGTTAETPTATTSHEYATSGKRIATLRVRDSRGALSDPYTVEVFPGNTPPVPAVTAPGTDYRFRVGSQVGLSGAATDPEDGTVQGASLKWEILRHHNASHAHPYDSGTGGSIAITAPPPEDLSSTGAGNNLEVRLTATDSEGLRKTVSRRLEPRRVYVTLRTAPVRLGLIVNGARFRAPRTLLLWHGYGLRVEAPRRPKSVSGRRWAFKSWSDGRSRRHVIPTPASGATYTARYKRPPR